MRRWLWVLCVVACSRRIDHFHDVGDGGLTGGADAVDSSDVPVVCPHVNAPSAVACAKAGFGWPTALAGDAHAMSRLADVNGDAKLDLVSPEISHDRVAIALGNGDGTFLAPSYLGVGSQPVSLDVGDLDGDGDVDIVVGAQGTTNLSIIQNLGSGMFAPATTLAVSKARTISIAKIDADNRPDLVVASTVDQTVSVVLATSTGWAAPTVFSLGFTVMAAATGDLDNDGDVDIVAVGSPAKRVTLTNNGAGAFTSTSVTLSSDGNDVAVTNFDGDAIADVGIAEADRIEISTGSGSVFTAQNFQTPKGITAADIDNDGKRDFVVVGSAGLLTIRRAGPTISAAGYPLELPAEGPEQVAAGDLDGDGHVDLVTSSTSNRNNGVLVLRNSGTGAFTLPVTVLATGGTTMFTAMGDLDGDGRIDAIRVTAPGFQIYWQDSDQLTADNMVYFGQPGVVAIGDVTVDGLPDIVIATATNVRVFRGTGQRHFVLDQTYPIGGATSEIHLVDLGGNCAPEIVLVHPNAPTGNGPHSQTFAVMANRGNGTFDPEVGRSVPNIVSATVGDFDDDGKMDVVVAGIPSHIGFFHGNGDNSFNAEVSLTVISPEQIASADINGDGHRDLIVSSAPTGNGYSFATMRGFGTGSFASPVFEPSMLLQTSGTMQLLDFDGNSTVDVVFKNDVGIGVHLSYSDGTFDPLQIYPMGGTPVLVGDFDGDKRADALGVRDMLFGIVHGTCGP